MYVLMSPNVCIPVPLFTIETAPEIIPELTAVPIPYVKLFDALIANVDVKERLTKFLDKLQTPVVESQPTTC